jgi:hypothetical protein
MQKYIINSAILIIVAAAIILFACKKDENISNLSVELIQCSNVDIPFIENPYPIEQYLINKENPDEEKMDRQLYEIGLKARDLFTNTDLNRFIIDNAIERANDCIDLRTFKEWSPISTGKYSTKTVDELDAIVKSTNLQNVSKSSETYGEIENYIPAIFVVNIENADPNKMPIFSPGVFVNEDLPGMEKYEDHIVIWYFDTEKNDFVEGLISEEMALKTSHPILIVDNACEEITNRRKDENHSAGKAVCNSPNTPTYQMTRSYYCTNEYQVNTRSETSGKSEFCVVGALINENGVNGRLHSGTSGIGWWLIAKVAKADIGKPLSKWVNFCRPWDTSNPDVTPFECNYIFWNSFERDWAKSPKSLGTATANGKTVYLDGNMKNASDWYAYAPNEVQSNRCDLPYIFNNWAKWHEKYPSKGKVRIWRVDP